VSYRAFRLNSPCVGRLDGLVMAWGKRVRPQRDDGSQGGGRPERRTAVCFCSATIWMGGVSILFVAASDNHRRCAPLHTHRVALSHFRPPLALYPLRRRWHPAIVNHDERRRPATLLTRRWAQAPDVGEAAQGSPGGKSYGRNGSGGRYSTPTTVPTARCRRRRRCRRWCRSRPPCQTLRQW
jgi:hypothetical protein